MECCDRRSVTGRSSVFCNLRAARYTSSTGARLTFSPALSRFFPAPVPAVAAAVTGWAASPICFSDRNGRPGSRRTAPPSWSVISSSGSRTGLRALIAACCSSAATWLICVSLEMLPAKKTTPAAWPLRIRNGQAAGVVFFAGNISSETQISQVAAELQQAAMSARNPVREPLLLMTDQEGGAVRRLPGRPFRSEKQIGEAAHPVTAAATAGTGAGKNLLSAGLNVNLAPVLDVYRTAGNFIDEFGRSYSMEPHVVSALGAAFITAQQQTGVAATGKHFPGLGAARRLQNTDERPVTLRLSQHSIRTVDELPYKAAITAGVKLVMASWAAYPALGSHRPAGLSSKIVQGELRQRLGYTGVTITDSMGAGALVHYGTTAHRSVLAATAGMDLLLCASERVGQGIQGLDGLLGGYRDGTLNKTAFRAAVRRIIALRVSLAG